PAAVLPVRRPGAGADARAGRGVPLAGRGAVVGQRVGPVGRPVPGAAAAVGRPLAGGGPAGAAPRRPDALPGAVGHELLPDGPAALPAGAGAVPRLRPGGEPVPAGGFVPAAGGRPADHRGPLPPGRAGAGAAVARRAAGPYPRGLVRPLGRGGGRAGG